MADFVAVLKKTIGGLADNTPELRQKVYEKARATIAAKLAAISPPPPQLVVDRQKKALEDAIAMVEAEYAPPPAPVEDDLDAFLADFGRPADPPPPAPRAPPAAPPMMPRDEPPAYAPPVAEAREAPREEPPYPAFVQEPRDEDRWPAQDDGDLAAPEADDVDTRAHDVHADTPELEPVIPAHKPEPSFDTAALTRRPRRRRGFGGLVAAALVLVVIAGAAYGIWLNRAEFVAMLGLENQPSEVAAQPQQPSAPSAQQPAPAGNAPSGQAAAPQQPATTAPGTSDGPPQKFTQRLMPTGEEVDDGAGGAQPSVGEGTSVAAATQPSTPAAPQQPAPGAPAQPTQNAPAAQQPAVPVGQRAIFYEERTSVADATADQGAIVWSVIQESPGGDLPPEPAVRAEVTFPSKDLQLRLTFRRNADATLPASHIVEMIFLTPDNFAGGSISNVLRIAFKPSEEAPGNPLLGIPAKIADGYFLIALSDQQADAAVNTQLMQRQNWIDIPIVYGNGRRALVSLEKGLPGERAFNQAIQTWQKATAG